MGAASDPIVEQLAEINRRAEVYDRRAEERHRALIGRGRASERVFIAAFSEIETAIERSSDRADRNAREHREAIQDMRASIRANTDAVLAVLDRLEPPPG